MRPTVPFQPSGRHSSATPSDGTRCAFGSTSKYPFGRDKAFSVPVCALSDGHKLDKAHIECAVPCKLRERRYLVVVHPAHQHRVQLDVRKTGASRCIQTGKRVGERADARDFSVFFGVERVS